MQERENRAATVIQARMRGYIARLHYHQLMSAALILQKRWRARKICQEQKTAFLQQKNAAVAIQRWYCQRRQHRLYKAAVVLQKNARALLVRRCYIKTRTAVVVLQSAVRRWMALKEVTRMKHVSTVYEYQLNYMPPCVHLVYCVRTIHTCSVPHYVYICMCVSYTHDASASCASGTTSPCGIGLYIRRCV